MPVLASKRQAQPSRAGRGLLGQARPPIFATHFYPGGNSMTAGLTVMKERTVKKFGGAATYHSAAARHHPGRTGPGGGRLQPGRRLLRSGQHAAPGALLAELARALRVSA